MSDCPKCSPKIPRPSRRRPIRVRRGQVASAFLEPSPFIVLLAAELAKARDPELATIAQCSYLYSIRVADNPGTPCAACRAPTGHGPVGYRNDEPMCDGCLLDASPPLGLTLCLVAVTRAFAVATPRDAREASMALAEVGAFARIFERVASTWGPARFFVDPTGGGAS